MIIPINDKWRVESDRYEWRCCKRGNQKDKNTGEMEVVWTPQTHHSTLEQAVNSLYQLEIRLSDAEGLTEVLRTIRDQHQTWVALLEQAMGKYNTITGGKS